MRTVNDFAGKTDNDRIDEAIRNRHGDIVVIPPRVSDIEPERDWWLLDRAILLPENTTILLQNCRIKLSDKCRDNFFRSANCGLGIENPLPIGNIHIRGVGDCVLEGADHPRATGDSSKFIACPCPKNFSGSPNPTFNDFHRHSYGTDGGKEGESENGYPHRRTARMGDFVGELLLRPSEPHRIQGVHDAHHRRSGAKRGEPGRHQPAERLP